MQSLHKVLEQADKSGVAIGHFNVSDLVTLKAVFESANEMNVPVIIGASEGEREFMGVRQISAVVKSLRDEFGFPIFLMNGVEGLNLHRPQRPAPRDGIIAQIKRNEQQKRTDQRVFHHF